jgi:hypothetical protein
MSKREVEPVAGFVRSSRCAELPSLLGVATNERFLAEGSDPPRINPAYLFIPALTVGFKLEILSEISVYFSFWEANDFGREFDEWQAALLHQVVNCPSADIQASGNL